MLSRVVLLRVVLLSLLLVLGAGTSSVLAAGPYPPPVRGSATVSASRVQMGDCVIFSGSGFAAFTDVRITDNGKFVGTTRTNAKGEFRFKVCFNDKCGRHILRGTGEGADGAQLTVSASVFVECRTERPPGGGGGGDGNGGGGGGGGAGNGGGDGNGGGLPFTGFVGPGLLIGSIALLGAGSLLVLVGGRRRSGTTRRDTLPA